ncbi:TetR family transcriptional regulator [Mycobacterium tuberculosis]|nr:TetR family transcriptional regulator [Mycobacterium tuberculosis]
MVGGLLRSGTRNPRADAEIETMAVALVGAGEAIANRLSTGDTEVDEAAALMIDLFWRGLKGTRADRDAGQNVAAGKTG